MFACSNICHTFAEKSEHLVPKVGLLMLFVSFIAIIDGIISICAIIAIIVIQKGSS
ncbi:hypothetical protein EC2785200_0251 [Escherichia coli 2785200]|nr:hypothetical protein EC2785200_0251 [Escherichia coli 2785200]